MHTHFYTISGDGLTSGGSIDVPCPAVLPVAGDILIVEQAFMTPGNQIYKIGDEVHLMKRTEDAPFGKHSSLGNWLAISKFGPSVWSNIEWALAEGKFSIRKTPRKGSRASK
jgi:hypothetical protein